jgi:hypothetical protein
MNGMRTKKYPGFNTFMPSSGLRVPSDVIAGIGTLFEKLEIKPSHLISHLEMLSKIRKGIKTTD